MKMFFRPNVFLAANLRPPTLTAYDSYMEPVRPILEELTTKGDTCPRTIIYLPLKWCGEVHLEAQQKYGIKQSLVVSQYHSPQTEKVCIDTIVLV